MPIDKALSKPRHITNQLAPQEAIDRLERTMTYLDIERVAGNLLATAKAYGAGAIIIGGCGQPHEPLDLGAVNGDLWLNVITPLEMVGSIRNNQNPNAQNYFEPNSMVVCRGVKYHASRCITMINPFEPVLSFNWSSSAFGFAPQSCYERPLRYLQEFLRNDEAVTMANRKAGAIIHKKDSSGGYLTSNQHEGIKMLVIDKIKNLFSGSVAIIGKDESIEAIDLQHLSATLESTRGIILDNIAMASSDGMPSSMLRSLMLGRGMSEGDNDKAKEEELLIKHQNAMQPALKILDKIAMAVAWNNSAWFNEVIATLPDYKHAIQSFEVINWKEAHSAVFEEISPKTDLDKITEAEKLIKIGNDVIALAQSAGASADTLEEMMRTHLDNINDVKVFDNDFSPFVTIEEQQQQSPFDMMAGG
jgi:hypothetical protein